MTWAWGTVAIKDSGGTPRSMRAGNESGTDSGPFSFSHLSAAEGFASSYSAGFDITGYATPTDLFALAGSASKLVKIRKISINGQASSAAQIDLILIKRSSANSGGSPTTLGAVAHDSLDAAASAALVKYGAAPTLGTLAGAIRDSQLTLPGSSWAFPTSHVVWEFGTRGTKPVYLRGANELLALNFQGAAVPAGMSLSVDIEWTEE